MLKEKIQPNTKSSTDSKPSSKIGYQTGFNANGQSVNHGQAVSDYGRNAFFSPLEGLTDDGERGLQDLNNSMTDNAQAQMGRILETQNAEKNMQDQFVRSELTQQGLANQAQIYGDISQRAVDQMGLAAKLQEATIRNNFSIANQRAMAAKKSAIGIDSSMKMADNLMKGSLLK
jgi:hypothetical protein